MRIVIEIDGDNVAVHTDRQPPGADSVSIVDAGPAPTELLREFGGMEETKPKAASKARKGAALPGTEWGVNPLRAGEAIARHRLGYPPREEGAPLETIDAGRAPKLPKSAAKG